MYLPPTHLSYEIKELRSGYLFETEILSFGSQVILNYYENTSE